MKIKISKKGYKEKPNAQEIKKITWDMKNSECKEVTYKKLSDILQRGHSVLLAEFSQIGSIAEDNITSIECIALDVDSKEQKSNMFEFISLLHRKYGIYPTIYYPTFSDMDNSKFRLIYKLEYPVDSEVYKSFYKALVWKFRGQLDSQTVNPNRIWAGTNKKVYFNEVAPIPHGLVIKLINSYQAMLRKEEEKTKAEFKASVSNKPKSFGNIGNIKAEYRKELADYLIQNVDLKNYIEKHFGGRFERNGNHHTGCCVLHGGDNQSALAIYKNTYRCYTNCGTGNIITVAKKVYNSECFDEVATKLIDELSISVPTYYWKERR